jgi:hypothetical protein
MERPVALYGVAQNIKMCPVEAAGLGVFSPQVFLIVSEQTCEWRYISKTWGKTEHVMVCVANGSGIT